MIHLGQVEEQMWALVWMEGASTFDEQTMVGRCGLAAEREIETCQQT